MTRISSLFLPAVLLLAVSVWSAPASAHGRGAHAQCVQLLNIGNHVTVSYAQPCAPAAPVKIIRPAAPVTYYQTPQGTVTIINTPHQNHHQYVRHPRYSHDLGRHHAARHHHGHHQGHGGHKKGRGHR